MLSFQLDNRTETLQDTLDKLEDTTEQYNNTKHTLQCTQVEVDELRGQLDRLRHEQVKLLVLCNFFLIFHYVAHETVRVLGQCLFRVFTLQSQEVLYISYQLRRSFSVSITIEIVCKMYDFYSNVECQNRQKASCFQQQQQQSSSRKVVVVANQPSNKVTVAEAKQLKGPKQLYQIKTSLYILILSILNIPFPRNFAPVEIFADNDVENEISRWNLATGVSQGPNFFVLL